MVCQMFSFFLVFRRILLGEIKTGRRDVTRHRSIRLQGKNQPCRQSQPSSQRQHTPLPLPFCSRFSLYFTLSFFLFPFPLSFTFNFSLSTFNYHRCSNCSSSARCRRCHPCCISFLSPSPTHPSYLLPHPFSVLIAQSSVLLFTHPSYLLPHPFSALSTQYSVLLLPFPIPFPPSSSLTPARKRTLPAIFPPLPARVAAKFPAAGTGNTEIPRCRKVLRRPSPQQRGDAVSEIRRLSVTAAHPAASGGCRRRGRARG
jgi:hypothetical protein